MKNSLYRFSDRLEIFFIYLFCFVVNALLIYAERTYQGSDSLIGSYINSIVEYRLIITIMLTFLVIIFCYQFITRKKTEIRIRFLVGETSWEIRYRYFIQSMIIMAMSYFVSLLINIYLSISLMVNLYLIFIFINYILVSTVGVKVK